jgi:hypothetical protein
MVTDPRTPLLGHARRAEVWSLLESCSVRQTALRLVAGQWLDGFISDNPIEATQLEPLLEDPVLRRWRETRHQHPAASVVSMHRRFGSLSEKDVVGWLSETPYARSTLDATALGELIAENRWRRAADRLADVVLGSRGHLDAAIHRCAHLLGRTRKFQVSIRVPELATTQDEWWEEFSDCASFLFPTGINDTNIWVDSGGDPSLISVNMSGRDQWMDALRLLRHGGGGQYITVDGLLHQMRKRFYYNSALETLEQAYQGRIRRSYS